MSRRRDDGFTLVEIMIALTIGAILLAGMFRTFNTIQQWWVSVGIRSDERQNGRVALETVTRDLEMAGYQTTNYGDANKTGIAITYASAHEIEMDEQRPVGGTLANPVYEPRLVYYHLATDINTGRQNLYRQIRTFPGRRTPDQIVAENVSEFTLGYFGKDNTPVDGLPPQNLGGSAAYAAGVAVPANSPLRAIRRIQVTLTTIPSISTSLTSAVAEGAATLTVAGTAGFPSAGTLTMGDRVVTYTAKDPLHFAGCSGVPAAAAGSIVSRKMLVGPAARAFTLTASVTPQNLDAADEVTADNTPPSTPAGLGVIDTRNCSNKLRVKWTANTEADLAGYYLYYGPTGRFNVPIRALTDKNDPRYTLNPGDLIITKNADRATAPNTYAIRIAAYDSSGNVSGKSVAVSGNPSPDVTDFSQTPFSNDSTVNPLKPAAPSGLTVAPGAQDGELVVSWPLSEEASAGYRLYRSTAAFPNGHVDGSLQLKDESALQAGVTSWTDKDLEGCRTYYYALASVNCDETLVANYLNNNSNPAASDYAVANGTPRDSTTTPPAPGLACSPVGREVFVTLTNPLAAACPDFDRTEIFWSKAPATPPHLDGTVVNDGAHIPDSDSGSEGIFKSRGSQVIDFDSEVDAEPLTQSLDMGGTYNLLAFSADRCGNVSPATSVACELPECVDSPPGPAPASFTNGSITSCEPDSVVLRWEYPGTDTVADLSGFRIARAHPSGSVELTYGPASLRNWSDTVSLVEGAEYTYTVTATDCSWEQYMRGAIPRPYLDPLNTLTLGPVHPGGLRRYQPPSGGDELAAVNFISTVSDETRPYTYHNNVKFALQNTSQSRVTIKRMVATWDNPYVVLDKVVIGGAPSGMAARTVSVGGVASGSSFSVDVEIPDVAGGVGSPSGAVPVLLRFTTPAGAVNKLTDMRSETLNLSLWGWNHSLTDTECAWPTKLVLQVPRGPLIGGFSQSAPGSDGIDAYEVAGQSGTARDTDIEVPYGIPVNVFGTAFDNSRELFSDGVNRGFAALKLVGISAAAADPAAVPVMPSTGTFFERPLYGIGGDRYAIHVTSPTASGEDMPQASGAVIWYYALAVDNTGNWDRVPDTAAGNYAYYQPPFDVCTVSPAPPVLTMASTTPSQANLSWTAPTAYTSGLAVVSADSFTYDVYIKTVGGDPWPTTPAATDISGLSYRHEADLLAGTYYYMVRAKNSCSTGPRPSADSNVVTECEGASGLDCSMFSVPATAKYGESIVLSVSDFCAYHANGVTDSVVFRVQSGATTTDFTAPETGDGGGFSKTITAVYSGGGGNAVAAPSGSLSVNLVVAGATPCSAKTVTLTGGACFTTPDKPSGITAVRGASGSGAALLSWIKPNYNTDGTALTDLAGYQIDTARCATWNSGTGTCSTWAAWSTSELNDPAVQSHTMTGLVVGERYKFRMRAKDTCTPPNISISTGQSSIVRIQ